MALIGFPIVHYSTISMILAVFNLNKVVFNKAAINFCDFRATHSVRTFVENFLFYYCKKILILLIE
jgi:hypothetical protein